MKYKYTSINPESSSKEEILLEIERLTKMMNRKINEEQAVKIFINSVYGATASPYFVGYNIRVAEAITLQGQEMTKFVAKIVNRYFNDFWHKDKELHKILGLSEVSPLKQDVTVYGDTDSIGKDSVIYTDKGKITIEDLYNESQKTAGETIHGHESVFTDRMVLNWNNSLYFAKPKRIIRHKVTKEKWLLKLKNGKSIEVTNDHSMIVFRNGNKLTVKPSEILSTDKILCVKKYVLP